MGADLLHAESETAFLSVIVSSHGGRLFDVHLVKRLINGCTWGAPKDVSVQRIISQDTRAPAVILLQCSQMSQNQHLHQAAVISTPITVRNQ